MIIYEGNAREKRPSIPNLAAEAAANNNTQQPPGWRRCQLFSSFFFYFPAAFSFFYNWVLSAFTQSHDILAHENETSPPSRNNRGRRWEKLFPCSGLTLKRQTLSIFLGLSFLFVFPSPFRLFPVKSGIDKWRHEIAIAQLSGLIHFRLWNNNKKKTISSKKNNKRIGRLWKQNFNVFFFNSFSLFIFRFHHLPRLFCVCFIFYPCCVCVLLQ